MGQEGIPQGLKPHSLPAIPCRVSNAWAKAQAYLRSNSNNGKATTNSKATANSKSHRRQHSVGKASIRLWFGFDCFYCDGVGGAAGWKDGEEGG